MIKELLESDKKIRDIVLIEEQGYPYETGPIQMEDGTAFDIDIMDSTHLRYKIKGTKDWSTPIHFNQMEGWMKDALIKIGTIEGNFFKESFND